MANTYSTALTNTSDHIRFALADTDVTNAILSDEEINAKISAYGFSEALAQCADAIATKLAQEPDSYSEDGGISISYKSRIDAMNKIAEKARAGFYKEPTLDQVEDAKTVTINSELMTAYEELGDTRVIY